MILVIVIPEIVLYYRNRFKKRSETSSDHMNEVMFFTDKGLDCKEHVYSRLTCLKESCAYRNLRRLIQLVEEATSSLDICMFFFTCQDLSEAIISVHRKGVRVRVITDAEMADGRGTQIPELRKYGVPVRMKKSVSLMHHKFIIINNHMLVSGSCNWTMKAFTENWENILVTSVPNLVMPFSHHFSQLWKEFSELDYKFQV